jgi:hypothetical protein
LAHPEYASQVVASLDQSGHFTDRNGRFPTMAKLFRWSQASSSVAYLESAIGIATDRPADDDEFGALLPDEDFEEPGANFHDELTFLLLEGVISERRDDDKDDSDLEDLSKQVAKFLEVAFSQASLDHFLNALPSSFQEKALVLGRLVDEDALRIFYRDLHSLDLALEYCDDRHEQQKLDGNDQGSTFSRIYTQTIKFVRRRQCLSTGSSCPRVGGYGTRDGSSDQVWPCVVATLIAAALRLLPQNVPVSAVARPFLIPALVDSGHNAVV